MFTKILSSHPYSTCSIDPDFFAISHSELEIGSKILQNEFSTAVHKERILNPHNEMLMRRFQHHLQDPEPQNGETGDLGGK